MEDIELINFDGLESPYVHRNHNHSVGVSLYLDFFFCCDAAPLPAACPSWTELRSAQFLTVISAYFEPFKFSRVNSRQLSMLRDSARAGSHTVTRWLLGGQPVEATDSQVSHVLSPTAKCYTACS